MLASVTATETLKIELSRLRLGSVDPLLAGSRISLNRVGRGMRSGIFIVSDTYRLEDEQRALASGVAGYLVRPITLDIIRASRAPMVGAVAALP